MSKESLEETPQGRVQNVRILESERLLWLKLTSRHQIWLTSVGVYWPHCACNNASLAYAPERPADGESMVCSPEFKVTQG
jgi:hypothetical protein